ncbi:MAG: TolC family protein [Rikenellaceae bacterium]
MKRVLILAAAFICTTTLESNAQQLTLTLDGAVQLALDENPTIKIADMEIERYDYVRKTTMSYLLPQASIDGTLNRTLKSQDMAKGFSFSSDPYNTFTTTANLSLALYSPSVYRTLKMNRSQAEAAVESARSSRIDLIAEVKNSFYGILLAEQSLAVLEENSKTAKQTVDESQIKYQNGILSEYDLLTAQVQYSNLQPLIIQTEAAITIAKDLLKMYLFLPTTVDIEVKGDLNRLRDIVLEGSSNLALDLSGNSSLRSLALQSEILESQLRVSQASRLPTLAAYGSISLTGNNMVSTYSSSSSTGYFWQQPSSVGLSLSIPIFQGLYNVNAARSITNQIDQLTLTRAYTEQSVVVSISNAITNINTAREQMFAQEQTVSQAKKAYTISESRYNAGAGTILELNSARLSLTQAELSFSQAIYDLLVARSEYDKIIGIEN